METKNRKALMNREPIDEDHIMKVMAVTSSDKPYSEESLEENIESFEPEKAKTLDDIPAEKQEKRESRKRKSISTDYESLFIRSANIKAKVGKTIYLRPEYHRRVARILQLLEENSISLTDYVDNVFAHHFAQFEQEIREFCLKNNDPII